MRALSAQPLLAAKEHTSLELSEQTVRHVAFNSRVGYYSFHITAHADS